MSYTADCFHNLGRTLRLPPVHILIQTLSLLQEDALNAIQDPPLYQTPETYVAPVLFPPFYAVAVNLLLFASPGVVLVAAFLCMVVKEWIQELDRNPRGIPDL